MPDSLLSSRFGQLYGFLILFTIVNCVCSIHLLMHRMMFSLFLRDHQVVRHRAAGEDGHRNPSHGRAQGRRGLHAAPAAQGVPVHAEDSEASVWPPFLRALLQQGCPYTNSRPTASHYRGTASGRPWQRSVAVRHEPMAQLDVASA